MLYGEKDLFVDVKKLAVFAKDHVSEDTILTDEPIITVYYSNKYGLPYSREEVKPGCVLALHNFFSDFYLGRSLEQEMLWLGEHWNYKILYEAENSFIPLSGNAFSGEVMEHIDGNFPLFLDYRYKAQKNRSLLIQVISRKEKE